MAGELLAQGPDEELGPGAGVELMVWMGCEVARVPLRAVALFPQGIVAPQSRVRGRLGLCFWRWRCGRK
jgi:hypothetical protein